VVSFLESRGISLDYGDPGDPPDKQTVCGLGNRKNRYFTQHLAEHGVEIYESTVDLIRGLRAKGMKTAIFSASKNCEAVLKAANVSELFDAKVDGVDADKLGLPGKPDPAVLLEAARRLEVAPGRAVIVEDAIAGVQAGRAGRFGLVIGVNRSAESGVLGKNGADVEVTDLREVTMVDERPAGEPSPDKRWSFVYEDFEPEQEKLRETLCTLGNGYFATRGAAPEADADDVHYSGTYLAGGYNRLTTEIAGRTVESEDLVNLPNWLPLTFRIEGGAWFDLRKVEILDFRQELNLKHGVLLRTVRFRDSEGRRTTLASRRFVHMASPHLAGLETTLTSEDWSGRLEIRFGVDLLGSRGARRRRARRRLGSRGDGLFAGDLHARFDEERFQPRPEVHRRSTFPLREGLRFDQGPEGIHLVKHRLLLLRDLVIVEDRVDPVP